MADKVVLSTAVGVGDSIAADDLGAFGKVQWVKLVDGADGGTGLIGGDATNGLDVDVTRVQGTVAVTGPLTDAALRATPVPVSGTVDTELTTADLDTGAGTDTRAVVGLIVAKSGGAANVSATDPLPVVVGSTVPVQIQGGANQIGKLAANSGVIIGDVNVVTEPGSVADNAVGLPAVVKVVGGYDGTNVQALATNAAGNLQVGLSAAVPAGANAIGSVTVAGTTTVDTELPAAAALADGAANPTTPSVGANGLLWNGATWDRAKGDATNGAFVNIKAMVALPTGTNTIGNVGELPLTAGGLTIGRVVSAASTNATSVKGSVGQVYLITATNINAAVRYLKLYNKASAPTVGSDTPVLTIAIPGNAAGAGIVIPIPTGLAFATGIALALTTGATDADTGAVAANEIIVSLGYK